MVNTSSKKRPMEHGSSSEESESENEYQVEAIIDKRTKGKKVQYLLKWKGYSDADNTWENETNMNCPDLVREFEENYKKNNTERKSNGKNESKTRKRSTKSKKAKVEASDEEDHSDGESSKANDDESGKTRDHNVSSASTTATHEELMTSNCESLERTRLRSASKTESANGEVVHEVKVSTNSDYDKTTNNGFELVNRSSPVKENSANESPVNLRLRITPSAASSPSITLNDSDNNNNMNNKSTVENEVNNHSHDLEAFEMINDDEEPVEKIEGVRNDQNGISFRIKLSGKPETEWMSAKVANRKYPQAVIAFWESHVEFT
ncbi:unnamed protein product [Adineta ricciae]|uniref:Chromo domain-containing protein n=1 Tax=Adineta ricciae TaxID=249248 RepID=A0A813ZGX9_ADIRI|nr:unnamed protein product [Adineta ricciae]